MEIPILSSIRPYLLAREFNRHYSPALICECRSAILLHPFRKLRPEIRATEGDRSLRAELPSPTPIAADSLLFLRGPLSSLIVGRKLEVPGRSGISARDRYKTFNGFETHSSTAAAVPRLFASFALPPPPPPPRPPDMRCRGAHANFRRTKSIMERPFLCLAKKVETRARRERE